jgi:trans-2,3-dihydro-3-hydroxyanthranilate isomerase
MRLEYLLIDVFTDRPFGGSRLTLFPDGGHVPPATMQRIAMEMGAGETAFVMPGHRAGDSRARLRVFTPSVEIPFAGHSLLGATFALDALSRRTAASTAEAFSWELEAGIYQVSTQCDDDATVYSLRHDTPAFLGQYFHRDKVARALGIPESEIAITGLPCEVISTGLPIHIVPIGSLETVAALNLRKPEADAIAQDLGFGDLFVFTCETVADDATVHCRMFAPHFGIPEDPASGAATGSLAAYLVKHRLVKFNRQVRIVSEQGLEMGRPSRLVATAEIEQGQATRIEVGGHCVLVGAGHLALDD